ncbi:MAG TPA: SAM-dependent methyltransferase [Burkholderiales bacterium]|nr:SAM-dependent methyltransferase [Burkholderiales bacterium]
MRAILYVVPTPLGGSPADALPPTTLQTIRQLADFVVENEKSARAFFAAMGMPRPLRELRLSRLDEHTAPRDVRALLAPLREGRSLGLLSEAGCPAIADPGAALVAAAHDAGFRVAPLVGPSAILLALMASGLEGQRFSFCGYLPREAAARTRRIRELEQRSRTECETEIFIETPYRNDALLSALLATCAVSTRLCLATDLTLPDQSVALRSIGDWRRAPPVIGRRPTVFLMLAA